MASACGLAHLLQNAAGIQATAAYGGIIGRAENKALIKVLHLPIQPLSRIEPHDDDLLCLVDTQPEVGNYARTNGGTVPQLVIDHHPVRPSSLFARFHDVGGPAGATSTLVCRYLRAAKLVPSGATPRRRSSTASRATPAIGAGEYDPADVEAYNWLFPFVDKPCFVAHRASVGAGPLFRGLSPRVRARPEPTTAKPCWWTWAPSTCRRSSRRWRKSSSAWKTYAGRSRRGRTRTSSISPSASTTARVNAGKLVREICGPMGGSAGGHGAMAGARIPLRKRTSDLLAADIFAAFLRAFHLRPGPGTPLVPIEP